MRGARLLVWTVLLGFAGIAWAQGSASFPSKPIRFIVPFPPGGGADATARTLAAKLTENLGQTVVVESRAGAGGNIGTEFVARAPADGYTILLTTNGHTIQPHLQKLSWDPVKDFTPLSIVATYPVVIAVHPSVPARTLAELVSFARANPGKLTYGSSGNGGPLHVAAELFKSIAGVNLLHVPYKGNAPMTIAVLAGEVSMVFDSLTGPLPHIRAGKLHALATSGKRRIPVLSEVPTVIEQGIAYEYEAWNGIVAPGGLPREIAARLNAEIVKAVATPEVANRLTALGYAPVANSLEDFNALIASDLVRYGKLIREANIKAD